MLTFWLVQPTQYTHHEVAHASLMVLAFLCYNNVLTALSRFLNQLHQLIKHDTSRVSARRDDVFWVLQQVLAITYRRLEAPDLLIIVDMYNMLYPATDDKTQITSGQMTNVCSCDIQGTYSRFRCARWHRRACGWP